MSDPSYSEFSEELNISPGYLRKVAKRLDISGYKDPNNRSRKLLTEDDRNLIRSALGRNTDTTPIQSTDTWIAPRSDLVLVECEVQPLDFAHSIDAQNVIDSGQISQHLARQMVGFNANLDAFCSSLRATVAQQVIRSGSQGLSDGIAQLNGHVPVAGGKP